MKPERSDQDVHMETRARLGGAGESRLQEVELRAIGVPAAGWLGRQATLPPTPPPPIPPPVPANFCQIVWFFSREAGNTDFFFFFFSEMFQF